MLKILQQLFSIKNNDRKTHKIITILGIKIKFKKHKNISCAEQPQIYYEMRGDCALEKLIKDYTFDTVLDIGCGEGYHANKFKMANKQVTAIDYGDSVYFKNNDGSIKTIIADFNTYNFDKKFDCIWCCHVLEHQLNVNMFLTKIYNLLNEGGVLAITVPPLKSEIVGGHVSLWNPGLLLYNLVLAGFDCSNVSIRTIDYDISIIVTKNGKSDLQNITFDAGDIKILNKYFPKNLSYHPNNIDTPFDGNIQELNW